MIAALLVSSFAYGQVNELSAAYGKLRSFECLVSRDDQLHGGRQKIQVRFRGDGKVLLSPMGEGTSQTQFSGSALAESPLANLLQKEQVPLENLRSDGTETLQGVPTRRFLATWKGSEVQFWIGERDGLLRRFSRLGPGKIPTLVESYTAVRINPELTDSAFIVHAPRPVTITRTTPSALAPSPSAPLVTERFDLGKLSPVETPSAVHDFIFVNRTQTPLKLTRAQGSCGCLSTLLGAQDGKEVVVAPGKSSPVRVSVALAGLAPGQIQKSITVFAEGQSAPVARYELGGQVLPSILFEPATLSFSTNTPKDQSFQVIVDERLLQKETLPALEGPVGLLELSRQVPAAGTRELRDGVRVRRFAFKARLSPAAPLGSQVGRLSFSQATGLWKGAGATVIAQVQGAVSAAPSAVAFGAVTALADTEQVLTLTYQPGAEIARQITADSPFLKAEMVTPRQGALTETVRIRLLATCPNGVLQSRLQVRLKNGQLLSIPVTGYIQRSTSGGKKQ